LTEALERIVGAPLSLVELKRKPGRRRTLRARGPNGSAIVKVYASERAAVVARRVASLGAGPPEVVVPEVLHVDPDRHVIVLSDVPGRPLREALLDGAVRSCKRAGSALGTWHAAWEGVAPEGLRPHTVQRELEVLRERAANASAPVARVVEDALPHLAQEWESTTVVHRDLYEEQVLVGRRVGLIDIDDAALGPPELDVGNLLAHIELLELRRGCALAGGKRALLDGYGETGPKLDQALLDRCRSLTLLRLACLNNGGVVASSLAAGALA
jgi:aminoglycoside phosphotransferase (APT) family kinase protein